MPKPLNLSFLYYFSCPAIDLLEVKINGLEEGTPPDQVYHWLHYDRATQQFQKLSFKSMGSENGRNYRKFEQGDLQFDASRAHLELKTGAISEQFTLKVNEPTSIPEELVSQIRYFLQQKHGIELTD